MKKVKETLSSHSYAQISAKEERLLNKIMIPVGIALFFLFIASLINNGAIITASWWQYALSYFVLFMVTGGIISCFIKRTHKMRSFKFKTIRADRIDLMKSKEIDNIINRLKELSLEKMDVTEQKIGGVWTPFRVERMISYSIRADIECETRLNGKFLFGASHGVVQGVLNGSSMPNLLETSTLIFLKNENTKQTLRVLVPNQQVITAMLERNINYILNNYQPKDSHIGNSLSSLKLLSKSLRGRFNYIKLIDRIDSEAQNQLTSKSLIEVYGKMVQPGLVIATKLVVDLDKHIIFPTGLLNKLYSEIQNHVVYQKRIEFLFPTTNI
jgi:hypothetical protein